MRPQKTGNASAKKPAGEDARRSIVRLIVESLNSKGYVSIPT